MSESPPAPKRPGSARRLFAATVLVCEAFVVFFAALVAFGLQVATPGLVFATGAASAVVCLAAVALLPRRAGYVLGTVVQVLLLLSGVLIPMMLVLGAVFAALWFASWRTGGRIDAERAERYEAELAAHRRHT